RRHTRFSRDWSSDVCSSDLRLMTSCTFAGPHTQSRGITSSSSWACSSAHLARDVAFSSFREVPAFTCLVIFWALSLSPLAQRSDGNLRAALGPACNRIRQAIRSEPAAIAVAAADPAPLESPEVLAK